MGDGSSYLNKTLFYFTFIYKMLLIIPESNKVELAYALDRFSKGMHDLYLDCNNPAKQLEVSQALAQLFLDSTLDTILETMLGKPRQFEYIRSEATRLSNQLNDLDLPAFFENFIKLLEPLQKEISSWLMLSEQIQQIQQSLIFSKKEDRLSKEAPAERAVNPSNCRPLILV